MNLIQINPKFAVRYLYKQRIVRMPFEKFANGYDKLQQFVTQSEESEEHLKNELSKFLVENFYKNQNINTKENIDLVIYSENNTAEVLFEIKKPSNLSEMISTENPNRKALHELILYYFEERQAGNNEITYLIATNLQDWFIFDANDFDSKIYQNTALKNLYQTKIKDKKTNEWFYGELKRLLETLEIELEVIHFQGNNNDELQAIYKIFSPDFLLKLPVKNDSNSLNQEFYQELLHIMGLTETSGNVIFIERKKEKERFDGSLLETVIFQLDTISDENQQFEIALELVITWINRILFLKLLEAQLVTYHPKEQKYKFLNSKTIKSFDELNNLFFKVLAVQANERHSVVKNTFEHVPYLNSSLFEKTAVEQEHFQISQLTKIPLSIAKSTVLQNLHGQKLSGELTTLDYLFQFLDAYDFGSNQNELQEDDKPLINSAVLGLIFEKINGYKDGSFFTPGFITMYMCSESLRRSVVQKFNEIKQWNCKTFVDLQNKIDKISKNEANKIVNSVRICDPAVGSGHFLVSALNEMIAIKHDLEILCDKEGRRLRNHNIEIIDDELVIANVEDVKWFVYNPKDTANCRIQKILFTEKQTIIENCLFGVDINPNSVKICQLRLWIELLKNAYYKENGQLETLPNIDINIKCGNSLVSQFDIKGNYSNLVNGAKQKMKLATQKYKDQVIVYKSTTDKRTKEQTRKNIAEIKETFSQVVNPTDPDYQKLKRVKARLGEIPLLFTIEERETWKSQVELLTLEISDLQTKYDEKLATIYKQSFEWSFEFPEVLDENGNFVGFDVVIGNPPYIQLQSNFGKLATQLQHQNYQTFERSGDIYCLFYERGMQLLKEKGLASFITSNKWMRASYGEKLRKFLPQYNPLLLMDVGGGVFDSATVDTNILMTENANNQNVLMAATVDTLHVPSFVLKSKKNTFLYHKLLNTPFNPMPIPNNGDMWNILSLTELQLKAKIEKVGVPLKKWDIEIYRGILTGFNEAFIIDSAKRDELIKADPKSAEIIKPILRGRDIRRYSSELAGIWIINSHNGIRKKLKRIHVENYPAVKVHLDKYWKQLEQRQDKGKTPYNLRNCAYLEKFEHKKICWNRIASIKEFSLIDSKILISDSMHFITGNEKELKFLCGLLNSKLIQWLLHIIVGRAAGGNAGNSDNIKRLPMPKLSEKEQQPFIKLVDKILAAKKENKNTDELETEIDNLVYQLYGLTEEEIKNN